MRSHNLNAQVAQLVEQWTENPRVAGSIPALGTFLLYESFFPKELNLIKKSSIIQRVDNYTKIGKNQHKTCG